MAVPNPFDGGTAVANAVGLHSFASLQCDCSAQAGAYRVAKKKIGQRKIAVRRWLSGRIASAAAVS
jgi:hypothetical protein